MPPEHFTEDSQDRETEIAKSALVYGASLGAVTAGDDDDDDTADADGTVRTVCSGQRVSVQPVSASFC